MSISSHIKLFFLLASFIIQPLAATTISLELTDDGQGNANTKTVFLGIPFQVTISITDGNNNMDDIELAGGDLVKISGTSQSSQMSILNGTVSSQITHVFDMHAKQSGPLKLGPARIKQNGQIIESNALELMVTQAPQRIQSQSSSDPQDQQKSRAEGPSVACRLIADKKTAFVGEPIVVRLIIVSRGNVSQAATEPPKFPGFTVKEIQNVARRQENINNEMHNVLEKKYVLIPSAAGEKSIDPVNVVYAVPVKMRPRHNSLFDDAFFAGFFGQDRLEQKNTSSNALTLTIQALPEGQEQIDGVGIFTDFTAHTNSREAHVNEALTFSLELTGKGNLDQIPAPKLELPPFINAYESKASTKEDLSTDYLGGKKTFEYVIQVAQEGIAEIPEQHFSFFDTNTKTVKTLVTKPIAISLKSSPQAEQQKATAPIKTLADEMEEEKATGLKNKASLETKIKKSDISFIQEDGPIICRKGSGFNAILFIFLILLIPIIIFGYAPLAALKKRLFPNLFKNRHHKKHVDLFNSELETLRQKNHIEKLYQFFVKRLALKYEVSFETITHDWLNKQLADDGWDDKKINEFFDFLNECASFHFSSNKTLHANAHVDIFKNASYWLLLISANQKG